MNLDKIGSVGGLNIYRDDKGAVCFRAGCTVNADGSPHAYCAPNSGLTALDWLANAGSENNWWGIATDGAGNPCIQKPWHPAPGFYVSTTALVCPDYDPDHPFRYVDSERYCFGVIPGGQSWCKLGDVGLALNTKTGDSMYYAMADIGPQNHLGEGSMLLSRCLGLNPSPKTGGSDKPIIVWVVLPGSDPGYSDWETKCQTAIDLVGQWGGLPRLQEIASEI